MNTTPSSATTLVSGISHGIENLNLSRVRVAVFPPFININTVLEHAGGHIAVGAQNCYYEPNGAFTGEVSCGMIDDAGCTYVLIGHSERRTIFKESNTVIELKLKAALQTSLTPILCIGETLSERQSGNTWSVLQEQLNTAFQTITPEQSARLVIAYEPVWAIGTGVAATKDEAQEAHHFIRKHLSVLGKETSIPILYGGSVTADNARDLLSQPDIDGALIGGASLKHESFVSIIRTAALLSEN